MNNYYDKLEIDKSASQESIKKAYRKLSKKYHPDMHVGGNQHAEAVFKEIKEAYEVLSNPTKKAYYDYQLELLKQQASAYAYREQTSTPYRTAKNNTNNKRYNSARNKRANVGIDKSKRGASGILPVFLVGFAVIGGLIYWLYLTNEQIKQRKAALPDYKVKEAMRKYDHVMKYDYVDYFNEGRTWVLNKGKYGLIDLKGNKITEAVYDWAQKFNDGLAIVKRNGKYGFVNKRGKEVTDIDYDFVENFVEGRALVMKNYQYSFIDRQGKEIIRLEYDRVSQYKDGLASFSIDGKWGFIDLAGNEVIKATYEKVYPFSNGLAAARIYGSYLWGFINKKGDVVIPFIYDDVNSFDYRGIADVVYKTQSQAINQKGKCIQGCN
ncbi:hypothetical protein BKI52_17510 [marine bacterium AO1-C]|nr:hypothetical protein BKI52_17510 [marine bacterium AO1-C]